MSLDLKEIKKNYKKDSFVVLKNFIDKAKIKNLEESIKAQIVFHLKKHELPEENDFFNDGIIELNKIRKNKNNFDSIQVIYNLIRKLPELYKIVGDEKLIEVVRALSGLEEKQSPYIWEAFCRIDPPNDESFDLNWHQESYFTIPNSNSVQLWAPILNKVDLKTTGTMSAIKGSGNLGEIKHDILKKNNYVHEGIRNEVVDKINLEHVNFELSPGDIVLFHENLIHKTFHNSGNKVRFTMIANYSNPYLSDFKFMNEKEVLMFHKLRTGNAEQNKEYIQSFTSKGGIKDFSKITH